MVPTSLGASRIASAAARSPGHERQVGSLDRHVRAGADRDAEVGLSERRSVVDAIADHRNHRHRAACSRVISAAFLSRHHARDHTLDPNLFRDGFCRSFVVAGEQHRRQSKRPQLGDRAQHCPA